MKWILKTGLVGGQYQLLPDYFIPFLFLNFCLSHCSQTMKILKDAVEKAEMSTDMLLKPDQHVMEPFGRVQSWEQLLDNIITDKRPPCSICSALLDFFRPQSQVKQALNKDIHPTFKSIFPGSKCFGDIIKADIRGQVEDEMDRAHHRLSLHIDPKALLTNLKSECCLYVNTATAQSVVGNEQNFKVYLRTQSGASVEVHPHADHRYLHWRV